MAYSDICFADGDYQQFILEIDSDTLHQPLDIDTPSGSQSPVTEIAAVQANSASIF